MTITKSGVVDMSPKNDDEWKKVEDGAATVLVTMNTLKLPGYAREPRASWYAAADRVAGVARRAKDAAERQEKASIEQIGDELDPACEGCHTAFLPK